MKEIMKKVLLVVLFVIAINQNNIVTALGLKEEVVIMQYQETSNIEQEVIDEEIDEEIYNQPVYVVESEGNVEHKWLVKVEMNYNKIPENVRETFEKDNGRIIVSEEDLAKKFGYNTSIGGIFVYDYDEEKNATYTLYIENKERAINTVVHEIGHYVDNKLGRISESEDFKGIYKEEVDAFAATYKTHEGNYSKSSEYFAESFMNCFIDAEGMQANCPKTYEFIMEVVENV